MQSIALNYTADLSRSPERTRLSVASPATRGWHAEGPIERRIKAILILCVAAYLVYYVAAWHPWRRWFSADIGGWSAWYWITTLGYASFMYAVLAWRVILWRRYRPMVPPVDAALPSMSVIVPVFNEGALAGDCIRAALASRYPHDRLEIIVVDDGSTDDSWEHIRAAAAAAPNAAAVRTLRHERNLGKRAALALGFSQARGDVFVTLDSDSILDPDALRCGVAPLVHDPKIGAVAGCVRVLNARQSLVTRFLKCTFSLSFRFVRAYQNEFRGVFCTPGALSFYRAGIIRRVAGAWANQRFLGRPCVTGEDRALTNLALREGWLTAYQQNAVVHAEMPSTYAGMCRMLLRWARSNIRETIFLFRFLFTPFRRERVNTFRFNMLLVTMNLIVPVLLVAQSLPFAAVVSANFPHQLAMLLFHAAVVVSIYYANERDSDWVWLVAYQFLWVFGLSWIMPYAALTLRNTGWLTRGAPTPSPPVVSRRDARRRGGSRRPLFRPAAVPA